MYTLINKKFIELLFIILIFLITSCSPIIQTKIFKSYKPLDNNEEVRVFKLSDPVPEKSEILATINVIDNGIPINCDSLAIIESVKMQTRKAGGNAFKIIDVLQPNVMQSTCYRIKALILKVNDFTGPFGTKKDSTLLKSGYVLLHLYRLKGAGTKINYKLNIDNKVICSVANDWKKNVFIKGDTLNKNIWAETEVKSILPIKLLSGNEYYIRCGISNGALVGHPKIDLIDYETGKSEFESIRNKSSLLKDLLIFNDGREIECNIYKEDDEKIFFKIYRKEKEINTLINKSEIKEILKSY